MLRNAGHFREERGGTILAAAIVLVAVSACGREAPPALLTLIEPERMVLQDSELLPDSAKAAIRSYLSRVEDEVWENVPVPEMARLVGEGRGLTALLNRAALPQPGRTVAVLIDVPDIGFTEFRLARVKTGRPGPPTFVGQARRGEMSILLLEDSVVAGRITTLTGVFNFRSGLYGLINVAPADTSGALPELYLTPPSAVSESAAISAGPVVFADISLDR